MFRYNHNKGKGNKKGVGYNPTKFPNRKSVSKTKLAPKLVTALGNESG